MPRQLIEALTLPGQLILDPFTRNGVMGMVALENKRRYLLFDTNPSNATAINFRIKQELVWNSSKPEKKLKK
jgi:DNA modification methylase